MTVRILPPPQSPAAIEALEHMRKVRRARHREALAASVVVTDEVANRDPLTKPLVVTPPVERPLLAWPWRVLGGVLVVLWGLTVAAAAVGVAAGVGLGFVVAAVYLAAWVPVPVTAVVVGVVLFLGAWAVWAR